MNNDGLYITTVLLEKTFNTELTINQWALVSQLVTLLYPFLEFSCEFEHVDSSISLIISIVDYF